MATSEGKKKTLDSAVYKIQKQFGKGSIMRLGTDKIEAMPSFWASLGYWILGSSATS